MRSALNLLSGQWCPQLYLVLTWTQVEKQEEKVPRASPGWLLAPCGFRAVEQLGYVLAPGPCTCLRPMAVRGKQSDGESLLVMPVNVSFLGLS